MKPFCLLISTLAIAAGIYFGWRDARRLTRDARVEGAAGQAAPGAASQGASGVLTETRPGVAVEIRGADVSAESAGDPSPAAKRTGAGESGKETAAPEATVVPRVDERTELGAIEALLEAREFARASRQASRLATQSRGTIRVMALQLEAKALVFEKLLPRDSFKPSQVSEVLLSNGNTLTAIGVEDEAGSYKVTLASGVVLFLRKGEVAEIRAADTETFIEEQKRRMGPRVARLEHPIDVYIRGVRKLYQAGLPGEGYRLMEKLLHLPESHHIPLAFGGDDAEYLLKLWKVAAGEAPASEDRPGATQKTAGERPADSAPKPPLPVPAGAAPGELGRAQKLMGEGSLLYRNSLGKEGREGDLRRAYEKLRQAQGILAQLPPSNQARRLNRQLAQLIVDVGKALPLY